MSEILNALRWCIRTAPDRRAALTIGALSVVSVATFALPALVVARVVDDAVAQSSLGPIVLDLALLGVLGIVASASDAARVYEIGRAAELLAFRLRRLALR